MDHEELVKHIKGIRKIVINKCYGGFGLSEQAEHDYKELAGITDPDWYHSDASRDDPYLVKVVEDLGELAAGPYASLKVVEIPAEVDWEIGDYDGVEWIAEVHRTWS